jgi:A/G-specific adenine glycosylase
MENILTDRLLVWYESQGRKLPWRGNTNAYAVWISEIMLQQTQVETVIPYFIRWMERFPTLEVLANSTEEDVLKAWEGLGYYSRARNLHRGASIVVDHYHGELPDNLPEIVRIPGIGKYTAGAILSIAYGKDEPVVDGNIRRVFARLFNITDPLGTTRLENRLWQIARQNIPPGKAGDYNQALMDLGAMICKPGNPICGDCPVSSHCMAYEHGVQNIRPVKDKKNTIPHITVAAGVIWRNGEVLVSRRPPRGLLGGMWEFPGGKRETGETIDEALVREIWEELGVRVSVSEQLGVFKHAYTHFRVTLHVHYCSIVDGEPRAIQSSEVRWVSRADLFNLPMGKLDRQISHKLVAVERNI